MRLLRLSRSIRELLCKPAGTTNCSRARSHWLYSEFQERGSCWGLSSVLEVILVVKARAGFVGWTFRASRHGRLSQSNLKKVFSPHIYFAPVMLVRAVERTKVEFPA